MHDILSYPYQSLINDLGKDWRVDFDDLNDVSYDLDIDNAIIVLHNHGLRPDQALSSPYFRPQILLALAEATRMARHVEWLDGMIARYHPQTIILLGRICVADTTTQKIKFAWDAKQDNDGSLWKHILCGESSDMALAFESSLEKYMTAGLDQAEAIKKSMAVAFNRWFTSPNRMTDCDHDTLNLIDGMITDNIIFNDKTLEKNAMICMTLMPAGESSYIDLYLQNDILKNPYYATIADPFNETHFSQILNDMNKVNVSGLVFSDPHLAARFALVE